MLRPKELYDISCNFLPLGHEHAQIMLDSGAAGVKPARTSSPLRLLMQALQDLQGIKGFAKKTSYEFLLGAGVPVAWRIWRGKKLDCKFDL